MGPPYKYGPKSEKQLRTCHIDLIRVFRKVLEFYDHSILEGHRGEVLQMRAYVDGKSKLKWPHGMHNKTPSLALDALPYPIMWPEHGQNEKDKQFRLARIYHFAGAVLGVAESMGVKVLWGNDWNRDLDFSNETFRDLPHWQLVL